MRRLPSLIACCLLLGCSGSADLERLCTIATEVVADESIPPEHKSKTIAERFSPRHLGVRQGWKASFDVAADKRLPTLRMAADDPDWTCPALEELWAPPAEPADAAQ